MTTCFDYGSNNGCDYACPVLWEGICECPEEVIEQELFDSEDELHLLDLYGLEEPKFKSIW